nr:helix-turn-helix domain-containing protein [uncultured Holophaga sp.]
MIPLERLPGFASWGGQLELLLGTPNALWVHGPPGAGVSTLVLELGARRGTPTRDEAGRQAAGELEAWLRKNPGAVLGAHEPPPGNLAALCIPLRLWTVDEAPEALQGCLEALALDLGVPGPLPSALGVLPCPGNLLELHNRLLRWKLLGQAPDPPQTSQLPLESDSLAENLHALERTLLHRALRRSYGNRTEAAQRLGVSRRQLYLLIDRHGDPVRGTLPVAPPPKRLRQQR